MQDENANDTILPPKKPDENGDGNNSVQNEEENENIDNNETSLNYISTRVQWNRKDVVMNEVFSYSVAIDVTHDEDDVEPRTVDECRHRKDWPKWKEAI